MDRRFCGYVKEIAYCHSGTVILKYVYVGVAKRGLCGAGYWHSGLELNTSKCTQVVPSLSLSTEILGHDNAQGTNA